MVTNLGRTAVFKTRNGAYRAEKLEAGTRVYPFPNRNIVEVELYDNEDYEELEDTWNQHTVT